MDKIFGTEEVVPIINGAQYKQSHKGSVIGILGEDAPPVSSRGERFYNVDRWTARLLVAELCKWAGENPGCMPTRAIVASWVAAVNRENVPSREIVIAETPDVLPLRTALALTGGGYHEALHTYYSCRRNLNLDEICTLVLPRWAQVKDWSKLTYAALDWWNIVEDIRIERRGCERFEGIYYKMCDLQDLILTQEEKSDKKSNTKLTEMSVIVRGFRDYGLNYSTDQQRAAVETYTKASPEAMALIKSGPLRPLLNEAMALSVTDDLGSLRVALDVLIKLAELGKQSESDQQAKNGQSGDGQRGCPKCGAAANHLIVRPKADGNGGQVPGKGIVTCTQCAFQQEVDMVPKPAGGKGQSKGQPGPKMEGFGQTPGNKSEEGQTPGDKGAGKSASKEGKGSGGKGKEEDKKDQTDPSEGSGQGEKEKPSEETGDRESEDQDGQRSGKAEGQGAGKDGQTTDSKLFDEKNSSTGAGGHHYDESLVSNDWSKLAEEILAQGNKAASKLDNNTALEQAIDKAQEKENTNLKKSEAVWRPYATTNDKAVLVPASKNGRATDTDNADKIIASVREETAYLRSRLRVIIRSMEQVRRVHGVKKGRYLSSRYMVDSKTTILGGHIPTRAYTIKGTQIDMTMAAAVVIDESGSMGGHLKTATRIMTAIVEPIESLGFPTLALGIRDGSGDTTPEGRPAQAYHRYDGVTYDIFKLWGESFRSVRWRFANTRATGGTPLSDGIQYALKALSARNEAHRFMFVVTDGAPNGGHTPVIRRQIRLAREAGIIIIGVGIGSGTEEVMRLFDDAVWTDNFKSFPQKLLQKINEYVDIRASKRGVRVKNEH